MDSQKTQQELEAWQSQRTSLVMNLSDYETQQLPKAFARWLQDGTPIDHQESDWTALHVDTARSKGGATLTVLPDESILATGKNPDFDTYTFTADTHLAEIRSLRLEALSHKSMVRNGPGRAFNGNMGLGTISIQAAPVGNPKKTTTIELKSSGHLRTEQGESVNCLFD